jgi:sulfate transport system substrate-binding protein
MRRSIFAGGCVAAVVASIMLIPTLTSARPVHKNVSLSLVAYSTPAQAYADIIPAFNRTKAGKGVSVTTSYGPSGSQSKLVAQGLSADEVNFSYSPDIQALVPLKIVPASWDQNQYHGNVSESVVAFGVRPGNPKHIHKWSDLLKKGLQVLTPNPVTSGGARWNIMAAYGAQIKAHKSKSQAIAYLKKLHAHMSVQDASARLELTTFLSGKGDVMIDYENDIMQGAHQNPGKIKLVVPSSSLLIENPASWTLNGHARKQAKAFNSFLYSSTAQKLWGKNYFWPVVKSVAKKFKFAKPKQLFNIRQIGGWPKLNPEFFGVNGIFTKIEQGR